MTIRIMGGPRAESATYNVKDYGAVCDGSTDDSAAWQACIDAAAAATGGGRIVVSGLSRIATGIALPVSGAFTITSPATVGSSYAYIQQGDHPLGGILTTGDVAVPTGANAPLPTELGNATYLFYATGRTDSEGGPAARKLTASIENLVLIRDATSGKPQAIFADRLDQTGALHIRDCDIANLGLYYHYGGSGQMDMVTILRNTITNGGWIIDHAPPWQAEIAGNGITALPGIGAADGGSWDNLSTVAQFLECEGFYSFHIHDNMLSSGSGGNVATGGTRPGAMIHLSSIDQTWNQGIHHNNLYGCSDAGIYIQSSWTGAGSFPQGGIKIDYNAITEWNVDGVTSALGAAIYIDSPVGGAITDVLVGPNQYFGKTTNSKYGIVVVGDPLDHKGISISPQQVMAGIATAAYRVNGTNSGGTVAADARSRIDPPSDVGLL